MRCNVSDGNHGTSLRHHHHPQPQPAVRSQGTPTTRSIGGTLQNPTPTPLTARAFLWTYGRLYFLMIPDVRLFCFVFLAYDCAEDFFSTVSEIAVVRCLFDMGMMDVCQPSSSLADDAIKGKWVRVPRDLNIQTGMWQLVRGKFFTCFHYTIQLNGSVCAAHVLSSYSPTRRHAHLGHTTAPASRYTVR